jgi:hypothetical protein
MYDAIFINCNWLFTWWQWFVYLLTKNQLCARGETKHKKYKNTGHTKEKAERKKQENKHKMSN